MPFSQLKDPSSRGRDQGNWARTIPMVPVSLNGPSIFRKDFHSPSPAFLAWVMDEWSFTENVNPRGTESAIAPAAFSVSMP